MKDRLVYFYPNIKCPELQTAAVGSGTSRLDPSAAALLSVGFSPASSASPNLPEEVNSLNHN